MTDGKSETLRIRGGRPLRGDVRLGPDLPVLESTLAIAALATGRSELQGVLPSEQIDLMLGAWSELGPSCRREGAHVVVDSPGWGALQGPRGAIECGRSACLLAHLSGVLSAQHFGTQLRASGAAGARVEHWVAALRARGAQIAARDDDVGHSHPAVMIAPLLPSETLRALEASLPISDSAAKDALLLSAIYAAGPTLLFEPRVSSDHLERAMVSVGLPLRRVGSMVALEVQAWNGRLAAFGPVRIPGSAAAAACLATVIQGLPGSDVTLRGIAVNPSRSGLLDVLRSWGAKLSWNSGGDAALREPVADLRIQCAAVRGGVVDAEVLVRTGDAAPALLLLGALSRRGVRLCELDLLSLHGDPAFASFDAMLAAFGIVVERLPGELLVRRSVPLAVRDGRCVDAEGDHTRALAACALALATAGETVVEHAAGALSAMYPGFVDAARELGAVIEHV